jgi:polysaccharide biosynthesis transport protein
VGSKAILRKGKKRAEQGRNVSNEPASTINFDRALRILRRRGPVVLVCLLIAAISAYVFAKHEQPQYTSTTSLLFSNNDLAAVATGLIPVDEPQSQAQQDTNVQSVGVGDIAAKTAIQLGPDWSTGKVKGAISATADSDTSYVTLSATAGTAKLAQRVASTYAKVFVTEQARDAVQGISSAVSLVTAQYKALTPAEQAQPQGLALQARSQSLAILAKLQTGNVSVAGSASLPSAPSSPRVSRDVALGGILGLLIGIGIAFVLERLDRRIRDAKELESIYDLPLLASVPERPQYEVLSALGFAKRSASPVIYDEVFNLLRSYLRYFSVGRELRTVLVISAGPGEGKTTVSYNLAKSAATLGSKTLLIEADLRRGTMIAPLLGGFEPGLSDVLLGDISLESAIHSVEIGSGGELDVLVAGEIPPPNPGELIESDAMESLLERARTLYELVVVDTPPLSLIADAVPLLTKVDGVIVVGRIGRSRRDAAEQLRKQLIRLRAPVLGIVANGLRRPAAVGRNGYGYYYQARDARTAPSSNGAVVGAESETSRDGHTTA